MPAWISVEFSASEICSVDIEMSLMMCVRGALGFVAHLLAVFQFVAAAHASESRNQSNQDAVRRDLFETRVFSQAEISPDGAVVAWVISKRDALGTANAASVIRYARLASALDVNAVGSAGELESCDSRDFYWSPDSRQITFVSDALDKQGPQVLVADLLGHASRTLTHLKGIFASPRWSPSGESIAVLFTPDATQLGSPLSAVTAEVGVVTDGSATQHLLVIDVMTGRVEYSSPGDLHIYEFDWAPDGRHLVVLGAPGDGNNNWYVARLMTLDRGTGHLTVILSNSDLQIARPRWSPDGTHIAYIGGLMSDEPAAGGDVYLLSLSGGVPRNLSPSMTMTATSITWLRNSKELVVAGIHNGASEIARINVSGRVTSVWSGAETLAQGLFVPQISLAQNGLVSAVVRQSFAQPPEVWAGKIGKWRQITVENADIQPAWGPAKSLSWTTEIGSVQGWLIYPRNFDPKKSYPLVVSIHGGPSWATLPSWPNRWLYDASFAARGYFVLMPNPRGSYGGGEAFTRANFRDFGYGDFRDVLSGVDAALEVAPIDPARIGITGWSYGGFMTMWAITQTSRFRAAVAGPGIADWSSYYGQTRIHQWMKPFFGAAIYDDPAVYAKSSPTAFVARARTPTLLLVGDSDGECPPSQSHQFWRALKTLGIPTELVIYPKEGHVFDAEEDSEDAMDRTVQWFDRYLKSP
jgi:dipeptidyl aminopeptidase/acylaminoacyl peptidase